MKNLWDTDLFFGMITKRQEDELFRIVKAIQEKYDVSEFAALGKLGDRLKGGSPVDGLSVDTIWRWHNAQREILQPRRMSRLELRELQSKKRWEKLDAKSSGRGRTTRDLDSRGSSYARDADRYARKILGR